MLFKVTFARVAGKHNSGTIIVGIKNHPDKTKQANKNPLVLLPKCHKLFEGGVPQTATQS